MSLLQNKHFLVLVGLIVVLTMLLTLNSIRSNNNFQTVNTTKTSEASASPPTNTISPKTNLKNFTYPNSNGVSSDLDHLALASNDSPKVITDWYKKVLTDLGYSVTNFVTTNNNNHINNKLEASGEKKISVEIQKNATEATTTIKVILQ